MRHIGNTLEKFIDRAKNKDQYDCARICVEVDLEVGLPEAIKIKVGSWSHVEILDYEQLPFKCRKCHVHGHFARNCPSNFEPEKGIEEGWNQVKREKTNHKGKNWEDPLEKALFKLMFNALPPKRHKKISLTH